MTREPAWILPAGLLLLLAQRSEQDASEPSVFTDETNHELDMVCASRATAQPGLRYWRAPSRPHRTLGAWSRKSRDRAVLAER